MKKLILSVLSVVICILALSLPNGLIVVTSYAQTPTATSSAAPTEEENQEQIERIKDIVASRVAELKLVEKRGVLGTVESVKSTQIVLVDGKMHKRIIDIDEITEFKNPTDDTFGISDVKKGEILGVIGLLNKGTDHILARFINKVDTIPERIEGVIKDVDRRNFVVIVVDSQGKEKKIDIDTSTKIYTFDEEDSFIKSGFTKLINGQRVFISGFTDSKDKDLLNAGRFIHFINLPPSKDMTRNLESASPTPTPNTAR